MAVGKSGAAADRDRLSISFGDIVVAENGWVSPSYREAEGAAYMKRQELVIAADLGLADGTATVWTCDLTHRYIEINADTALRLVSWRRSLIDPTVVLIAQRRRARPWPGLSARRQGRGGRDTGGRADSRAGRGTGHRHLGELSRPPELRQPRLPGLPPLDAALCLPQMAGGAAGSRARRAQMGQSVRSSTVSDAPCRPAARTCGWLDASAGREFSVTKSPTVNVS
jgi:hypothetical protein